MACREEAVGFSWQTNSLTAETAIGVYVLCPIKGGVDVYFQRQRAALDRCATADAAKARCEAHFNELKNYLKPVGPQRF